MNIHVIHCPLQICRKDDCFFLKKLLASACFCENGQLERKAFWNRRWPTHQGSQSTFICVIFVLCSGWCQALGLPLSLPTPASRTWDTTLRLSRTLALPCTHADRCIHANPPSCSSAPRPQCLLWPPAPPPPPFRLPSALVPPPPDTLPEGSCLGWLSLFPVLWCPLDL